MKEFSLLYLIINNLDLIQENIHLVESMQLFTEVNTQIFNEIISKLKSGEKLTVNEMNIDKQLLDKIDK